jgi:uncharacterized membrane protein
VAIAASVRCGRNAAAPHPLRGLARSRPLFDRVILASGGSTFGDHALAEGGLMSESADVPNLRETVRGNIEAVLAMEQNYLRQRTPADRLSDAIAAFTGTLWFVLLHLAWFGLWACANMGLLLIRPFDPYPFQLLCMLVSLEGVLIATFVLIKQNRMSYLTDRRAHVDLQINLLAEREVTRLLRLVEEVAGRLGVPAEQIAGELAHDTRVEKLVEELDQRMSRESTSRNEV